MTGTRSKGSAVAEPPTPEQHSDDQAQQEAHADGVDVGSKLRFQPRALEPAVSIDEDLTAWVLVGLADDDPVDAVGAHCLDRNAGETSIRGRELGKTLLEPPTVDGGELEHALADVDSFTRGVAVGNDRLDEDAGEAVLFVNALPELEADRDASIGPQGDAPDDRGDGNAQRQHVSPGHSQRHAADDTSGLLANQCGRSRNPVT